MAKKKAKTKVKEAKTKKWIKEMGDTVSGHYGISTKENESIYRQILLDMEALPKKTDVLDKYFPELTNHQKMMVFNYGTALLAKENLKLLGTIVKILSGTKIY